MTMVELKLSLSDKLMHEASNAGLLTPEAITGLLEDALKRRAARTLLAGAERATLAGSEPMSMAEIQAEVDAVRRVRKSANKA